MRLLLTVLAATACAAQEGTACTDDDVGYLFTECFEDGSGSKKAKIVEYWKTPCDGGRTLSANQTVKCDLYCADGEYYSAQARDCTKCPNGTYSDSDSLVVKDWTTSLSEGMSSYCHPKGCSTWSIKNGVLVSGDNAFSRTVENSLVYMINMKAAGAELTVTFKTESAPKSAKLELLIDEYRRYNSVLGSGLDMGWRTEKFWVSQGAHMLRIAYIKDDADVEGSDMAYIKSISIAGQEKTVRECTPCAVGEFAPNTGSTQCSMCPRNTKRSAGDPGDACVPCEAEHFSFAGSSQCTKLENCAFSVYGNCTKQGDAYVREPLPQTNCIVTDKDPAPCAECPPGHQNIREANGFCAPCADHEVLTDEGCAPCNAGLFPLPVFNYEDFSSKEGSTVQDAFSGITSVSNECTGECREADYSGNAWQLRKVMKGSGAVVALSSGLGHGSSMVTTLTLRFLSVADGTLMFDYFVSGNAECASASLLTKTTDISVTQSYTTLDLSTNDLQHFDEGVAFKAGVSYEIKFEFTKSCVRGDHQSSLNIIAFMLPGPKGAPSTKCVPCQKGHFCLGSKRQSCPKGTYQDKEGKAECIPCPDGKATSQTGQVFCRACEESGANADHTNCNPQCSFKGSNGTIDLQSIGNTLLGPIVDQQQIEYKGYYDLDLTNETVADELGVRRYFMKLCEIVNDNEDDDYCPSEEHAYACQRIDKKSGYSMGNWASYEVLNNSDGLRMLFEGGDNCFNRGDEPYPRRTNVLLKCDPTATELNPVFTHEDTCDYYFEMPTMYACPLCTKDSFVSTASECINFESRTAWHKKKGFEKCIGMEPPEGTAIPCKPLCKDDDFDLQWSECSADGKQYKQKVIKTGVVCQMSTTGELSPTHVEERNCVGSNKITLFLIIFACVFLLLLMFLCVMYRKKRQMEAKYSRLAQGRANEMVPTAVSESHDGNDEDLPEASR
ncbi:hypothetical protein DIPPA_11844 [Diplonema papillatum]|nr:hypothetical protein DIPPA_11844 [Diplonema papillatum]